MITDAPQQLVSVPCALCECDDPQTLFRAKDYRSNVEAAYAVVRCRRCGLAYTSPRPTGDELLRHYDEAYRPFKAPSNPLVRGLRRLRMDAMLRRCRRTFPKGGRLLEVGCGTGELLASLRDAGWVASGLEPSPHASRVARERHGLTIQEGTLCDMPSDGPTFDGILMRHSLEHMSDPLESLRRVARLLLPGGRCLALVPNLVSAESRLFGCRWYDLDLPRHLYHFTPSTLAGVADRAGLRVVRWEPDRAPNGLVGSLRNVLADRGAPARLADFWSLDNPIALTLAAPMATVLSLAGSGRMWMVAEKPGRAPGEPRR